VTPFDGAGYYPGHDSSCAGNGAGPTEWITIYGYGSNEAADSINGPAESGHVFCLANLSIWGQIFIIERKKGWLRKLPQPIYLPLKK
jgi:hypothetical protein